MFIVQVKVCKTLIKFVFFQLIFSPKYFIFKVMDVYLFSYELVCLASAWVSCVISIYNIVEINVMLPKYYFSRVIWYAMFNSNWKCVQLPLQVQVIATIESMNKYASCVCKAACVNINVYYALICIEKKLFILIALF